MQPLCPNLPHGMGHSKRKRFLTVRAYMLFAWLGFQQRTIPAPWLELCSVSQLHSSFPGIRPSRLTARVGSGRMRRTVPLFVKSVEFCGVVEGQKHWWGMEFG